MTLNLRLSIAQNKILKYFEHRAVELFSCGAQVLGHFTVQGLNRGQRTFIDQSS